MTCESFFIIGSWSDLNRKAPCATIRFLHFDYPFSAFRLYSWRLSSSRVSSCGLSLLVFCKITTFGKYIFQNVIPSHLKTNELIKYDAAMIPNTNNAAMIPNTIRMKPRSINFSKLSCTREWKRKLRISFVIPLICINFATNCFCDGQTAICYIKSGEHNAGVHTIWKLR